MKGLIPKPTDEATEWQLETREKRSFHRGKIFQVRSKGEGQYPSCSLRSTNDQVLGTRLKKKGRTEGRERKDYLFTPQLVRTWQYKGIYWH